MGIKSHSELLKATHIHTKTNMFYNSLFDDFYQPRVYRPRYTRRVPNYYEPGVSGLHRPTQFYDPFSNQYYTQEQQPDPRYQYFTQDSRPDPRINANLRRRAPKSDEMEMRKAPETEDEHTTEPVKIKINHIHSEPENDSDLNANSQKALKNHQTPA